MEASGSLIKRHSLLAFLALTYVISWAIWLPMMASSTSIASAPGCLLNIIAIAGPSIAALLVAVWLGNGQLRSLLAGFSWARVSARWLIIALALPLLMMGIAVVGAVGLGAPGPVVSSGLVGVLTLEFVRILFLGGPLGEELGWRGFALPRLQADRTAFDASVILGVVWGLWHVPLYFVPGTGQFETLSAGTDPAFAIGGFVGWTIGLSILFTWLFNQTRGSLIVVIAFHAAVNLAAFLPSALQSGGAASLIYVLVTWVVAIAVAIRLGRATLASHSDRHRPPEVLPQNPEARSL